MSRICQQSHKSQFKGNFSQFAHIVHRNNHSCGNYTDVCCRTDQYRGLSIFTELFAEPTFILQIIQTMTVTGKNKSLVFNTLVHPIPIPFCYVYLHVNVQHLILARIAITSSSIWRPTIHLLVM